MKKILFFIFLVGYAVNAQNSFNDYNMALIPAKFDFQKRENQYRINTTVKSFLKSKGFEVYLDNETMPDDFSSYNCNKVFVTVVEDSGMFITKLKVEFRDCKKNLLFTTDMGESAEKDYDIAYNKALLAALKTFPKSNYKYSGKTYYDEEAQEKIKAREVENISVVKVKKVNGEVQSEEKVDSASFLFTQKTEEGYIVKDTKDSAEVKMNLLKTSTPNVFIATSKDKNGTVLKKGNVWVFEYYQGGKLVSEELNLNI